jgi:uracil-DNA glycosylase
LKRQYPFWRAGFAIFYSPVEENARVVIVGANPGGDKDTSCFDEKEAARLPEVHDYFRTPDYPLARKMKDLFARAGREDLLRNSIKLNLNFFRSRNTAEWMTAPLAVRKEVESRCRSWVVQLVERIRPQVLLCEGMATYDTLHTLCGATPSSDVIRTPHARAYVRSSTSWGKLLGILHPTGARPSTQTWHQVADALRADLSGV